MVNIMKRLIPLFCVAILVPQMAFAAWWNPFSWKIFTRIFTPRTEVVEVIPIATSADSDTEITEIEKLRVEVEELKRQQADNSPRKDERVEKTPTVIQPTKQVTPTANAIPQTTITPNVSVTSNQTVTFPTSQDLSRAANNKSEIINLQNMYLNELRKLLDVVTDEVERANKLLSDLSLYKTSTVRELIRDVIKAERDLFMAYQHVEEQMIQNGEEVRRNIENLPLESFINDSETKELKDAIKSNISDMTKKSYEYKGLITEFEDDLRYYGLL